MTNTNPVIVDMFCGSGGESQGINWSAEKKFVSGCNLCRFSGNSHGSLVAVGMRYCQQKRKKVKILVKGTQCGCGMPIDMRCS
jgi:hypothetical protein